jgi:hypothetical protein
MALRAKLSTIIIIIPLLLAFSPLVAGAASSDPPPGFQTLTFDLEKTLLAKAVPDECFNGVGQPPTCVGSSVPKVNQAYVWGLTYANGKLWFGTVANTECLVLGQVLGQLLGPNMYLETPTWVCEYGLGLFGKAYHLPAAAGDWRPPKIYAYDIQQGIITERTADAGALVNTTTGLRSAGTLGDVVFIAGPSLSLAGGVNFFAFRASDGAFLEAKYISIYNDIRRWLVVDGVLYCGVGKSDGTGAVLRWVGTASSPFTGGADDNGFVVVGNVPSSAADLALHENRIFVHTWPSTNLTPPPGSVPLARLIMGPKIPDGGLTPANADKANWVTVWKATDYEPDAVTARTYGGGALMSSGGYLYWGTMHVPFAGMRAAMTLPGVRFSNAFIGTFRAISVFRGKNFATKKPILELLYGEQYLPVAVQDPVTKNYSYTTGEDALHQNKMPNPVPKYGKSGFGNAFNTYTWAMEIYKGKLYVGTFDWTYMAEQYWNGEIAGLGTPSGSIYNFLTPLLDGAVSGADLFRFETDGRAYLVSNDGIGNITNYGVRNMLTVAEALYLGMANPMNLDSPRNPADLDPGKPQGGWELLELLVKAKH